MFPAPSRNQEEIPPGTPSIEKLEYKLTKYQLVEKECLIKALWHEGRGEPTKGIKDILSVIYNRKKHPDYPDSYCKIIHQPYQFSFVYKVKDKPLKPANELDEEILDRIEQMAQDAVEGNFQSTLPSKVLWYANHKVVNTWTKQMTKIKQTGEHNFYAKK